jgi:hypothetical protein
MVILSVFVGLKIKIGVQFSELLRLLKFLVKFNNQLSLTDCGLKAN